MTTKQQLYTGALFELGSRKYLTTEAAEARRVLDDVYDSVVAECLESGSWNHAMQFVKIDGDTGLITYLDTGSIGHGYQNGFAKPNGWVRTHALSEDEHFSHPLILYSDEGGVIKSDASTIYMRFTDTGQGLDLTAWPSSFARYVELELAARVCIRLTQDKDLRERIEQDRDKARRRAMNKDAMDESQPKYAPPGSWTQSRWGATSGDRGRRNRLTG